MFWIIKLCTHVTELFEIELIICIKTDLVLTNQQKLICHKIQTTKPNRVSRLNCLGVLFFENSKIGLGMAQGWWFVP